MYHCFFSVTLKPVVEEQAAAGFAENVKQVPSVSVGLHAPWYYDQLSLPSIDIPEATCIVEEAIFFQFYLNLFFPFCDLCCHVQFDGVCCVCMQRVITRMRYTVLHIPLAYGCSCGVTVIPNRMRIDRRCDSLFNSLLSRFGQYLIAALSGLQNYR